MNPPADDRAARTLPSGPSDAVPPRHDGSREPSDAAAAGHDAPRAPAAREPVAKYSPPLVTTRSQRALLALVRAMRKIAGYFRDRDPRTLAALAPFLVLALVLFTRHPATNYIFDEQEALLANPYVNGLSGLRFRDVIHRDFWGLPPDASIGSYRPLPNVVWRAIWSLHHHLPPQVAHLPKHPFIHHLFNIVIHALNGALVASFAFAVSRRRALGWLSGLAFVASAILTEAVCGIVGIADALGGLGAILALHALRLPAVALPFGVFASVLFGMFAKESALVCVPLVPLAALVCAPMLSPERPARFARALLAFAGAALAFVLYVELRRAWFPSPLPAALSEPLPAGAGRAQELYRALLIWFHQAPLPRDPINNPLVKAELPFRIAGALRVYWRGLTQLVLPLRLSGDYSFPQEPVPETLRGWETLLGLAMSVLPLLGALALWLAGLRVERKDRLRLVDAASPLGTALGALRGDARLDSILLAGPPPARRPRALAMAIALIVAALSGLAVEAFEVFSADRAGVRTWPVAAAVLLAGTGLLCDALPTRRVPMRALGPWPWRYVASSLGALGLAWIVISFFPHSNIPILLPTVRAERLWYFPVFGSALLMGAALAAFAERGPGKRIASVALRTWLVGGFFAFQCVQAYAHSTDYRDDLGFWRATKFASPNSAKAHLNYSVMVGARGDLETRLVESHRARELAPNWPMANIYTGDTLCRMRRTEEAWPHYARGFDLGPNDRSLIALALQCLYDEGQLSPHDAELRKLAEKHPGSWIAYLAVDTLDHHAEHGGVDPKYRPRSYNQGPKQK